MPVYRPLMMTGLLAGALCASAAPRIARAGLCSSCPGNAATVGDGIVFDELNTQIGVTAGGPALKTVTLPNGHDGQLLAKGQVFSASDIVTGRVFSGAALRGLILTIGMPDGREYQLELHRVDGVPIEGLPEPVRTTPFRFYVSPLDVVHDYDFVVKKTKQRYGMRVPCAGASDDDRCPDGAFKEHLCTNPVVTQDLLWTDYKAAVIFTGDHFDKTRTVLDQKGGGWFFLACDGTAAAKMHLLRHTAAGSYAGDPGSNVDPRTTTLDQRTAMLKAITADYCGDGNTWTGDGTPLYWTDARGWFPSAPDRSDLFTRVRSGSLPVEAIWGASGALCLNGPRRRPTKGGLCLGGDLSRAPAVEAPEVLGACSRAVPPCSQNVVLRWMLTHGGPGSSGSSPATGPIAAFNAVKTGYLPTLNADESAIVRGGYVMTVNDPLNPADYCQDPKAYPFVPYTHP